ncbi:MAG: helix-turn-helix domain-containing protein [Planctomycetes bacterium]|nr:helix-turn-helix domain-containing protein [Planctomycetota bacterium]
MLTVKDVCERLNVSRRTVYRLLQSGKLSAKRISGQWRFEHQDVDKLLTYKTPAKYVARPDLMSLNAVCAYLGLSRFTIYRLIEAGKLPAVKSGGRWRFIQSEVRQFLTRSRDVPGHTLGMHFEGGVMSLSQAAQSLGVNRRTIYRLVNEGKLPATKVAGVWRFIRTEVSRYMLDRKYSYGTTGVRGIFFYSRALDKYYKNKDTYYVKDSAYDGFVGSKQDYHDFKTLRSLPEWLGGQAGIHADMPNDKFFAELHYRKVSIKGGFILALTHKQYEDLPTAEYVHWSGFRVPDKQLRHLQV